MQLDRVVVGIDFSKASLAVAQWTTCVLAPEAEIVYAHVIDLPATGGGFQDPMSTAVVEEVARDGALRRLRRLADTLGAKRASVEVWRGDVAESLAAIARRRAAHVIVVGPHRQREALWEGLGTTAERLLAISSVPVLLATGTSDLLPRHVLIAVKECATAQPVLGWGEAIARRFDTKATTLSVVEAGVPSHALTSTDLAVASTGSAGGESTESAAGRDQWIAQMLSGGVGELCVDSEIGFGEAGRAILAAAARHDSGMIVMGRPRAGRVRRALLGSATSRVLRGASCPVLVVVERDANE